MAGELNAYRDARSQGIQPAGTSMKQIQEAHKASEVLNKPYDANTMPSTTKRILRTTKIRTTKKSKEKDRQWPTLSLS
jgi:hypothetical protein